MTNKLFIVKYVFFDIDIDVDKNFDINLDKRDDFDDTNFETIIAQNICVFDVAKNVLSNLNSIDVNISNIASKIKIVDEVKKI